MNNIIKRVWNQNRLVNIEDLTGMVFQAEADGHTFEISGVDDTGAAVELSGTVAGVFRRPDNADIALTGSASEGVVSVTLSEDCYAVPGRFALTIFVTSDGQTVAVYACVGTVAATSGGSVAGDTPQSVVDLIADIEAAVATIPPTYTDLMASIAPTYSSSALYSVGSYAWYDGTLYRCTTAITTSETWTAVHWEAAVVCDDVSEIASEVFTATTETLVDRSDIETSSTGTKNISLNTVIPSGKTCTVTITASETQQRASDIYWRNSSGNLNKIGTIAAGETTATFVSAPNADATIIRVNSCILTGTYSLVISSSVNQGNVTKNKEAIDKINEVIREIGKPEPITSIMTFSRGYWSGSTTFSDNSYRVGCSTPVTFSKDVVISALNGFFLDGYLGTTRINTRGVLVVPKETPLRLYIRRVWEDTTETADIDEFTTGVVILNYNSLSEYERYAPTFAGIEMFRTAAFLGDSYTATRLGYSWVDIVQNITGVSCTKYAKSGADSGAFITASSYGLPLLLSDPAKDLYWIALGINDGDRVDDNASYLGSISDISGSYEDYPDTFYGNYGHIIEAIQEHAPSAKIVLYKPIFQGIRRTLSGVSATKHGIKDVRDAIDVIAAHYNLPVMDSFDDVLYQSDWYVYHMDRAVSNGTHPAVMLYPAIAKANLRLFSECVRSYDAYFMDISYS